MAKTVEVYEVFISSPSDVSDERDVVQEAIEQINQLRGDKEGFRLDPLRWEKNVSSQIGGEPQSIINDQIGDDYDIFVGILCSRFGQETAAYGSGTEEEFFRAYQRRKRGGATPEILFYFKDPRQSAAPIDAGQLSKVAAFKEQVSGLGIYEEFDSSNELKTKILAALSRALERIRSGGGAAKSEKVSLDVVDPLSPEGSLVSVGEFDEDVGLIEITDMFYDSVEVFSESMGEITDATVRFSGKVKARTEELGALRPTSDARSDRKDAKEVIEKVAAEMQRYCHVLDRTTPEARRQFSNALRCMEHAMIISHQDGMSDDNDVGALVRELDSLNSIILSVKGVMTSFLEAVTGTPRMTSKLNQAKRRTANSIQDFVDFLDDAMVNVAVALESISDQ